MNLIKNKYFLLGNLLLILLAIPLTLFLVKRQQTLRGSAAPLTTLAVEPSSITANTCQPSFSMNVTVDPDQNLVSIVDMHIVYDATKLELTEIAPNQTAFPLTLRGPTYTSGRANISLSIGADVTKAIQTKTTVATLRFRPLGATTDGAVRVSLDQTQTRVFSLSRNDEPGENVLMHTTASDVTINQQETCNISPTPTVPGGSPSPIPSGSVTATPTLPPGVTATPTLPGGVTATPTLPPGVTATPTLPGGSGGTQPTPTTPAGSGTPRPTTAATPGPGGATPTTPPLMNQAPVCTGLTVDRATTGSAPYSLIFTAKGNDANGTIRKISFNFGEGPVQDIVTGGGIGTSSVSAQTSHSYNTPGSYNASVILTDNDGAISAVSTACMQTITVLAAPTQPGATGGGGAGGGGNGGGTQPTPTIEAPGSALSMIGIVTGVVLTLIGGFFLLTL